jgi:hypothetical protein
LFDLYRYFMRELVLLGAEVKPMLPFVFDLMGGQDLCPMHVHHVSDTH